MINDEKFITIDFETWETKYKPMERELERAKEEAVNERNKKMVYLIVKYDSIYYRELYQGGYPKTDRVIDIILEKKDNRSSVISDKQLFEIKEDVLSVVYKNASSSELNHVVYVGKRLAIMEQIENRIDNKIEALPWIVKLIFGIWK